MAPLALLEAAVMVAPLVLLVSQGQLDGLVLPAPRASLGPLGLPVLQGRKASVVLVVTRAPWVELERQEPRVSPALLERRVHLEKLGPPALLAPQVLRVFWVLLGFWVSQAPGVNVACQALQDLWANLVPLAFLALLVPVVLLVLWEVLASMVLLVKLVVTATLAVMDPQVVMASLDTRESVGTLATLAQLVLWGRLVLMAMWAPLANMETAVSLVLPGLLVLLVPLVQEVLVDHKEFEVIRESLVTRAPGVFLA